MRGVKEATLLSRVGRFTVRLADGSGGERSCHLHDPGRLSHVLRPGARVLYREAWRPGRRTSCDVVAVFDAGGELVLEDTRLPNKLWPRAQPIVAPQLYGLQSERMVNGTRVDFVAVDEAGRPVLVEVKGTNLVSGEAALFPDAPSQRAVRQLEALHVAALHGVRSILVFTVLRSGARRVQPNRKVDPRFARYLCAYSQAGTLELLAYSVKPVYSGGAVNVYFGGKLPVDACT
ncbi:MAG: DNA/RNA nuclease SfsA [Thermoproteota archaeon]